MLNDLALLLWEILFAVESLAPWSWFVIVGAAIAILIAAYFLGVMT